MVFLAINTMNQRLGGWVGVSCLAAAVVLQAGCNPQTHRKNADKVAYNIIEAKQKKALGRNEPFTIETPADTLRRRLLGEQNLPHSGPEAVGSDQLEKPKHWPEKDYPKRAENADDPVPPWSADQPLQITLLQALQVGARNSREYQSQKENVFRSALDLDLESDAFRNTYTGLIESILTHDRTTGDEVSGVVTSGGFGVTRRLKSGAVLAGNIGIDLAKLLSGDRSESMGLFADASVTIPLLRGAGQHIVTEPLTQAERNVLYAIWEFEQFKRSMAVNITSQYLAVLQQQDQVDNAESNYKNQVFSARRSRALYDEGRLNRIQLDQALQAELSARENWISARQRQAASLDGFKQLLGLPTDARIVLDEQELSRLAENNRMRTKPVSLTEATGEIPSAHDPIVLQEPNPDEAGPYEIAPEKAIHVALDNRPDLLAVKSQVFDAQRNVVVAADALKAGLDLSGSLSLGEGRSLSSAGARDSTSLRFDEGFYSTGLALDLPWERTAERNLYRDSYIRLERAVRSLQEQEDQVKLDVRDGLRQLLEARESYSINAVAVKLAEQRVESTTMSLELNQPGVEIRDVLEAQADLLAARNSLSASLVNYRVTELQLQRDMGVLSVNEKGLYDEFDPSKL